MNIDSVNSIIAAAQYGKAAATRKGQSMPKPVQDNASSKNNPNASAKINKNHSDNQNNISRHFNQSNRTSAAKSQPNAKSQEQSPADVKSRTGNKKANEQLSKEEREELQQLQQREQKVKAHEQAHIAAGGKHVVGGANFEYKRGPDGELYAVGGEVSIDTSKAPGDPEATIRKAQLIRRAALAPAEPSGQDRQVAAKARQMEMQARQEKMDKQQKDMQQVISAQSTQEFIDNRPSRSNSPVTGSQEDVKPTGPDTMTLADQVQQTGISAYQNNSQIQPSQVSGDSSNQLLNKVV